MTEFKLRKNPQKESQKALLKKHKKLVKEYEKRKEDIKQESIEQDEIVVLKNNNFKQERSASPVEEKAKFKVPEKVFRLIRILSSILARRIYRRDFDSRRSAPKVLRRV